MPPYIPPVVRFDQVRDAPIHWLWAPYLARGKSFLTADLGETAGFGGRTPQRVKKRFGAVARQVRRGQRRTPPVKAGEGKADRPPSRTVSALRPCEASVLNLLRIFK